MEAPKDKEDDEMTSTKTVRALPGTQEERTLRLRRRQTSSSAARPSSSRRPVTCPIFAACDRGVAPVPPQSDRTRSGCGRLRNGRETGRLRARGTTRAGSAQECGEHQCPVAWRGLLVRQTNQKLSRATELAPRQEQRQTGRRRWRPRRSRSAGKSSQQSRAPE